MPDERAAVFGDDFAAANAEAIAFARSCSEAQWQSVVPGEEWTVGVVVHHIAEGHADVLGWLEAMVQGQAVTETIDDIDGQNVEHAERTSSIGIAETVDLLQANGDRIEAFLRGLTAEQLAQTAPFGPAGGRPLPVSDMAEVPTSHMVDHLAHARRAVDGGA
jgi:hypothetical protein